MDQNMARSSPLSSGTVADLRRYVLSVFCVLMTYGDCNTPMLGVDGRGRQRGGQVHALQGCQMGSFGAKLHDFRSSRSKLAPRNQPWLGKKPQLKASFWSNLSFGSRLALTRVPFGSYALKISGHRDALSNVLSPATVLTPFGEWLEGTIGEGSVARLGHFGFLP